VRTDRPRPLTAAQQYFNLRGNPVCAGSGRLRAGFLSWSYCVSPTPLSRSYLARIEYRQEGTPQAYIDDPDLAGMSGERRLPHVYEQSPARLCLYLPGTGEWATSMRLDQTIVPWTALWLYYFEQWLISDVWHGGGAHPEIYETGSDRQHARRCRTARRRRRDGGGRGSYDGNALRPL
jgi:hypothetical protein